MPQANVESCDVAIVGGGPYGCLTALLLTRAGVDCVLIDPTAEPLATLETSLEVFWPSPNDPPTRAVVAHGHEVALALSRFCADGVRLFHEECGGGVLLGTQRVSLHEFERKELALAARDGLGLEATEHPDWYAETEQAYAASGVREKLLRSLRGALRQGRVIALEEGVDAVRLKTAGGRRFDAEIAVLASSHRIGALMPEYREILVPMTDVRVTHRFTLSEAQRAVALPVAVARGAIGHFAMRWDCASSGEAQARITGPRFLLPSAGAGLDWSDADLPQSLRAKIIEVQAATQLPLLLRAAGLGGVKLNGGGFVPQVAVGVDCLPCDELPLLGELGRHGRVLGGAGWLGVGLSAGMTAAAVTRDLILRGASPLTHPRFEPRRLRTN